MSHDENWTRLEQAVCDFVSEMASLGQQMGVQIVNIPRWRTISGRLMYCTQAEPWFHPELGARAYDTAAFERLALAAKFPEVASHMDTLVGCEFFKTRLDIKIFAMRSLVDSLRIDMDSNVSVDMDRATENVHALKNLVEQQDIEIEL